jgi:hypothetical protein
VKPYQIGDHWVDLDTVVALDANITIPYDSSSVYADINCAFINQSVRIYLGAISAEFTSSGSRKPIPEESWEPFRVKWEEFKTAWKTKDTMFGDVNSVLTSLPKSSSLTP